MKNKLGLIGLLGIPLAVLGIVGSIALAETSAVTGAKPANTEVNAPATTTPGAKGTEESTEPKTHGHRPLGGDGVVSSINGTTIVMSEESDEGAASYTVDASAATVSNNGTPAKLSDLKAGDKIFAEGTTNGTSVKATAISLGHPGGHGHEGNEPNEGPETNDDGTNGGK